MISPLKTIGFLVALFSAAEFGLYGEPPQKDQTPKQNSTQYVFKPVEITPSPDGKHYDGRFLFINKGQSSVAVSGFGEPENGKFDPRFVKFQRLQRKRWKDYTIGYCATGAQDFSIKPDEPLEFIVPLFAFEEQVAPLTCRIGVGDFWSEPFVLDWKKDRKSGKFISAKKERFEKVRAAFIKAGFNKGKLTGDDFCQRLFQSIMRQASGKDTLLFEPFQGELDVIPEILINGNIRIDFESDPLRDHGNHYTGWFVLNPLKFTPQWLVTTAKDHIEASEWGTGVQMELDEGLGMVTNDTTFYFCINYVPPKKVKPPSLDTSKKVFMKMLDTLGEWLTPAS